MTNTVTTTIRVDSAQAKAAFADLKGSIAGATAAGQLLASGIGAGIDAVMSGASSLAGAFTGAFSNAAQNTLENIGAAGDLARATGLSFTESQADIKDFTKQMSVLAKDLPGQASDFAAIGISLSDNLATGLKDVNGELDMEAFKKYREEFAKFGAMRTKFSGVQLADTNMFISKLLDGQSIASLKQLKFAEANVGVMAELERQLAESGKELKDMSRREIIELASTAIGIQDEVTEAARESAEGIMAGFQDGLFNEDVGLFGLKRVLDDGSTAYEAAEKAVKLVFGDDGLISEFANLFSDLGFSIDPMEKLADGIQGFNQGLKKVGNFIEGLSTDIFGDEKDISVTGVLRDISQNAITWLTGQYNNLFSSVINMDSQAVGEKIGELLAVGIDAATRFVADLDFLAIGGAFLNIANTLAVSLVTMVKTMDWGAAVEAFLSVALAAGLAVGASMAAGFVALSAPVVAAIAGTSVLAVAAVQAISENIGGWIDSLKNALSNLFGGIRDKIASMLDSVFSGGDTIYESRGHNRPVGNRSVANRATGLDQGGLFAAIAREMSAAPFGANPVIANDSELIMNRSQQGVLRALLARGPIAQPVAVGGPSFHFSGNQIIVQGNDNPKKVAQEVMVEIDRAWQTFAANKLAPSY